MNEPGDIRRTPDGILEYLKTQTMSLRGGLVEQWEPVGTHAAKYMPLPPQFLEALRKAGYEGGYTLYDLLLDEGWTPPDRGYVELAGGGHGDASLPRVRELDE